MIRIISLTEAGECLAKRIKEIESKHADLSISLWHKPQPFAEKVQQAFQQGDHLLFICATGIVVRALAPVIASKHSDPPVIVMDESGEFVIPLLSGHEGGANQWASQLVNALNHYPAPVISQLVQTTAKPYLNPVYTVGMGCERHCPTEELHALLQQSLHVAGLTLSDIHSINSIDIKADEQGLMNCAKQCDTPYQTFSVPQLSTVEHLLSVKSDYVFQTVGVYGVAESAALFAAQDIAGDRAELVLAKIKTKKATCAIARSYAQEPQPAKETR